MTAQTVLLQFVRIVDPYTKAGVEITSANIHSADGDAYTAQRRLDLYNLARKAYLTALSVALPRPEFLNRASGSGVKTTIAFTLSGSVSTAPKPSGFIMLTDRETGLTTAAGIPIRIRTDAGSLLAANNPELFQDATTLYAFEETENFVHYGTAVGTASTYVIRYIGHTDFTLAQIQAGTVNETFKESDIPNVLDLALRADKGASQVDLVNYAVQLLIGKS